MEKLYPLVDALFGYSVRGGVYLLVEAIAFAAALDGGRTPDSMTALGSLLAMPLGSLLAMPFGKALLALIALVGLLSFAVYCFIIAAYGIVADHGPPNLQALSSKPGG